MSGIRRVVFDTSSLVGAALWPGSVPFRALAHAFAVGEVCASPATLAELDQVLRRPRFDRYQLPELRLEFVALFAQNARLVDVPAAADASVQPPCRDPKDNKFLALAQVCEADALISSDADLQVLHPWNGVQVLAPAAYLAAVAA